MMSFLLGTMLNGKAEPMLSSRDDFADLRTLIAETDMGLCAKAKEELANIDAGISGGKRKPKKDEYQVKDEVSRDIITGLVTRLFAVNFWHLRCAIERRYDAKPVKRMNRKRTRKAEFHSAYNKAIKAGENHTNAVMAARDALDISTSGAWQFAKDLGLKAKKQKP